MTTSTPAPLELGEGCGRPGTVQIVDRIGDEENLEVGYRFASCDESRLQLFTDLAMYCGACRAGAVCGVGGVGPVVEE